MEEARDGSRARVGMYKYVPPTWASALHKQGVDPGHADVVAPLESGFPGLGIKNNWLGDPRKGGVTPARTEYTRRKFQPKGNGEESEESKRFPSRKVAEVALRGGDFSNLDRINRRITLLGERGNRS